VDFTREPIIETIITPREGHRLVVRNTKSSGQEEFIVDALEVITFGKASFFRNRERPKSFVVPVSDYEIVEVRDPRVGLKVASFESTLKSTSVRPKPKEEKPEVEAEEKVVEKKRKKNNRRKKKEESKPKAEEQAELVQKVEEQVESVQEEESKSAEEGRSSGQLLPPPPLLIKDEIERLRQSEQYKGAFYIQEQEEEATEADDELSIPSLDLQETYTEPEEENLYTATPAPEDVEPVWSEGSNEDG